MHRPGIRPAPPRGSGVTGPQHSLRVPVGTGLIGCAALPKDTFEHPPDQSDDLAAMESFRLADRQLGGGHLYGSVTHYLNRRVAPRLFGMERSGSMYQTLQAAAALTEMAGWMAHDCGQDTRARRHFESALPLTQSGADAALCAHVMASTSHLALETGRCGDAVQLARAGRERAGDDPRTSAVLARLHAMEGRALAGAGQAGASRRAIDEAERCLAQPVGDERPSAWISDFDAASLASEKALCLQDLGLLDEAATAAEHAVALRSGERARSRVFGQITLCMIRVQQRELEAACAVGSDLLRSCRTLGSLGVTQQLDSLGRAFASHRAERPVAEFLDSLAAVNQQRALLLAGISAAHSGR